MKDWQCGVRTPRMKGQCTLYKNHERYSKTHQHRPTDRPDNENTPRMLEFQRIVTEALDKGVQLTYVEIAIAMNHPNITSVASYGLGARYTRLRQKIYEAYGVVPDRRRRTPEQQIVRELKLKGAF